MKNNKEISRMSIEDSPDKSTKILREAGVFDSIQCHGYALNTGSTNGEKTINKDKKWWQFWK